MIDYFCFLDHNLLMVELKNEPKNCQGDSYGIFKQNSDVINNKPSWFNGEMAIWFSNDQTWMIGSKSELGKNGCGIESTIADVQSPALVGTNWEYVNENGKMIKANPGDISVINVKGKHSIKGKSSF